MICLVACILPLPADIYLTRSLLQPTTTLQYFQFSINHINRIGILRLSMLLCNNCGLTSFNVIHSVAIMYVHIDNIIDRLYFCRFFYAHAIID